MGSKKAVLRAAQSNETISLEDNTALILGRGPITQIKESRCSRSQVLLVPDFSAEIIHVTQLGRNPCGFNGQAMKKDVAQEAKNGDKIDILLGQFTYIVEFSSGTTEAPTVSKSTALNDVSDSDEESAPPPPKQPCLDKKVKRMPDPSLWQTVDKKQLLIFTSMGVQKRRLIAGYDLDHTIICTVSGNKFPKNWDDWQIMGVERLEKLRDLYYNRGFKIVLFTNQGGITVATDIAAFKVKIEAIAAKIKIPIQVYIALGRSVYRKPYIGMWTVLSSKNGPIDLDNSFYCGDAAGRKGVGPQKKDDFSQADVLFARNLGIKFYTPEEHFLNQPPMPSTITAFNPMNINHNIPLCDPESAQIHSSRVELVLMVGCQGSGKTLFTLKHMVPAGYTRINRDLLLYIRKCLEDAEICLQSRRHCVVDNTNGTVEAREKFIRLAQKYGIPVRAFVMKVDMSHAKHNLKFRVLTDSEAPEIGDAVLNNYFHTFQEPHLSEGLTEIIHINFWSLKRSLEETKLYNMFLCER